jgi:hypothetical protein
MARDRDLHLCIDRVVPEEYQPARATLERAVAEAARIAPEGDVIEIDEGEVIPVARLALVRAKMWENGRTLKCRFLDGSNTQQERAEEKAHMWEQFANVSLDFVASGDAEIRISFEADSGSWSAVGTDALVEGYFPKFEPTMNYGWLEDDTEDEEYERVVVHEFGHALGCIHEHQSPKAGLDWDEEAVYRAYSGPPNYWTRGQIEHNILGRYSKDQTNASRFDPNSIMLYHFPGSLFEDGKGTKQNTDLSNRDKKFIAKMYPDES